MDFEETIRADVEEPGTIVTKWVMVAEIMRSDGTRSLARTWSESCATWDVEGLLAAGLDSGYWDEDE
jgi:hypothetical protein